MRLFQTVAWVFNNGFTILPGDRKPIDSEPETSSMGDPLLELKEILGELRGSYQANIRP